MCDYPEIDRPLEHVNSDPIHSLKSLNYESEYLISMCNQEYAQESMADWEEYAKISNLENIRNKDQI